MKKTIALSLSKAFVLAMCLSPLLSSLAHAQSQAQAQSPAHEQSTQQPSQQFGPAFDISHSVTVQQVLAENRKVVGGDGRQLIYVPMQGATTTQPALPSQAILPDLVSPTVEATNDPVRAGRQARGAGREENVR